MKVVRNVGVCALCGWLAFLAATRTVSAAAPASENLLPTNTVVLISLPHAHDLAPHFKATQFGRLLADPAMQPFVEELKARVEDRWEAQGRKIGLSWEDIREIPRGEVALAISRDKEGKSVATLLVDITGNHAAAAAILAQASQNLVKEGAKARQQVIAGVTVSLFDLPPPKNPEIRAPKLAIHGIKDDVLFATTDLAAATQLLTNWDRVPAQTLSASLTFKAVMKRIDDDKAVVVPDVRWFVRPVAYLETLRADDPKKTPPGEPDMVKIMADQEFYRIYGVAGTHQFGADDFDSTSRLAVYCPELPDHKALRMLVFPNIPEHKPWPWVPDQLSGVFSFNWNVQKAFDGFGSFFDAYLESEGEFEDLIQSVKDDPNGPRIDLRTDLVQLLGTRGMVISDYSLPFSTNSRQKLIAIEAKDPARLAANVAASVQGDPNVAVKKFGEYTIFEMHETTPKAPRTVRPRSKARPQPKSNVKIPPTAICVAHDCLLISTHVSLLEKILVMPKTGESLAENGGDYERMISELKKHLPGPMCIQGFARMAETTRPTYELALMGKLYEDQSMLGQTLRQMTEEDRTKIKLDGKKLPPFASVEKYFGLSSFGLRYEPGFGWFGKAITLNPKEGVAPEVADQGGNEMK